MKIYSNVEDPGKKKKSSTEPKVKKGSGKSQTTVELTLSRGTEKRKYTPASVETGHKAYGKVGSGGKVKSMLDRARSAGVDVAHDTDGKPYRAGHTTVTKSPDKVSATVDLRPHIPQRQKGQMELQAKKKVSAKPAGKKKPGKLKPMAATYGVNTPKGGGTLYKNRVKAQR
jgi:hypothetical protein